jgi:hypothetical protein
MPEDLENIVLFCFFLFASISWAPAILSPQPREFLGLQVPLLHPSWKVFSKTSCDIMNIKKNYVMNVRIEEFRLYFMGEETKMRDATLCSSRII